MSNTVKLSEIRASSDLVESGTADALADVQRSRFSDADSTSVSPAEVASAGLTADQREKLAVFLATQPKAKAFAAVLGSVPQPADRGYSTLKMDLPPQLLGRRNGKEASDTAGWHTKGG